MLSKLIFLFLLYSSVEFLSSLSSKESKTSDAATTTEPLGISSNISDRDDISNEVGLDTVVEVES